MKEIIIRLMSYIIVFAGVVCLWLLQGNIVDSILSFCFELLIILISTVLVVVPAILSWQYWLKRNL